jgi:Myb-like DNA-binding domain
MSSNQNGPHHPPSKGGNGVFSWTKDDDMRLTEIMKKYKNPRDWEPISKELNCGKSSKECHERWIRYLKPGVRKGQWTDYEDAIVIEAVTTSTEQPFTRWSDLAQRLPGRVGKQIRDRWVNHLNPNINHLPFSREDDLLLWDGHKKLGKRWVEISTKFFNSSRSENHIKNRWYSASFKKFISNEFGAEAYNGNKGSKYKEEGSGGKSKKGKVKMEDDDDDATVEVV